MKHEILLRLEKLESKLRKLTVRVTAMEPEKEQRHCCESWKEFILDTESSEDTTGYIRWRNKDNEYGQRPKFCPWCGEKKEET